MQPEVVEMKLLEAEDRASNAHPSLSQWMQVLCYTGDP